MRTRHFAAFIAAFVLFINMAAADGLFPVETRLGLWTDSTRAGREVPYRMYLPQGAPGALAIVIFSHGLGGNRDGATYLLEYLAAHGYIAVAVQHHGSDTPAVFPDRDPAAIQERVRKSISPSVAVDRFEDIPFTIDSLDEMNRSDPSLHGHLDMSRIGMSGHSYGAITTLILAGQTMSGARASFADERIRAAIAYSPSKPKRGDPAEAFADIRIPTFHMTGTNDRNPIDPAEAPADRLVPYQSIRTADKFLLVFNGGDHMVYSGRDRPNGAQPNDEKFHELVQKASLAFWDMQLKALPAARAYLTDDGLRHDLGESGTYEFRLNR